MCKMDLNYIKIKENRKLEDEDIFIFMHTTLVPCQVPHAIEAPIDKVNSDSTPKELIIILC